MIEKFKKILPKKLLARLLLIFFVPLILIQCLAIFFFYDRHWEKIITRFSNIASNQVSLLINEYEKSGEFSAKQMASNLNLKFMTTTQIENNLISYKSYFEKKTEKNMKDRIGKDLQVYFGKEEIILFIKTEKKILKTYIPRKYLLSETPTILFLWIVFSSLILSLIAFLFLRNQVRAIYKLAKSAEEFGEGKEIKNFKPTGATEIRLAGHAFLKMRRKIKNYIAQRTSFLAGISHDLGTVITRIKLQLELLNGKPEISSIKNDVNIMQMFLKEYLDYSEKINLNKYTKIKVLDLLEEVIHSSKKGKSQKILVNCNKKLIINSDKNCLYRIVFNLVDNACKYGNKVLLKAVKIKNNLTIEIDDDGPGIPIQFRKKIFKPFYKIDSSRNLNQGGSGLGLSIAKELAGKLKGKINITESKKLNGSCFQIKITDSNLDRV